MKRFLFSLLNAVGLLVNLDAQATVVTVSWDDANYGYEFNVSPVIGGGYAPSVLVGNGFQTFCLERDEDVDLNNTYNASVNGGIAYGGGFNTDSGDPISRGTAWLYDQFTRGVLLTYNYAPGAGRAADADVLQDAIWMLEQEQAVNTANYFVSLAIGHFGSLANAMLDNNGQLGIGVLHLTTTSPAGHPAQDFLVRVPDGGASIALLGMALLGVGAFRRRFSR
jgi:hypothetical protein